MANLPKCNHGHKDCFAVTDNGKCMCLNDTTFKNRKDCPFYKPEKEAKEARALCFDKDID